LYNNIIMIYGNLKALKIIKRIYTEEKSITVGIGTLCIFHIFALV